MKIRDMHGRGWPVFSFEFFPPKSDEGAKTLMSTVADLKDAWKPDFVSVTYGAGGSTRDRTLEVVGAIQRDLGITTMAHLTCVGSTRDEIGEVVERLIDDGIQNILALRGDPPKAGGARVPRQEARAHRLPTRALPPRRFRNSRRPPAASRTPPS
jgi:methylenetetrahydrofolate reductase (NADPH)